MRAMVSGAAGLGLHSGYTPSGLGRLSPLSLSVLIRTAWPMMAAPVSALQGSPLGALSVRSFLVGVTIPVVMIT